MFRRKGADLVIEKNLTLVESLCGFDFAITHMDKRSLRVKSNPGQVGSKKSVLARALSSCCLLCFPHAASLKQSCRSTGFVGARDGCDPLRYSLLCACEMMQGW